MKIRLFSLSKLWDRCSVTFHITDVINYTAVIFWRRTIIRWVCKIAESDC